MTKIFNDPLAKIGVFAIFFPFLLFVVLAAAGLIDLNPLG